MGDPDQRSNALVELIVQLRWPLTVIVLALMVLLGLRWTMRGTLTRDATKV